MFFTRRAEKYDDTMPVADPSHEDLLPVPRVPGIVLLAHLGFMGV